MSGCVLCGSAKQCLIMTCHQDVGCACLDSLPFIEQEQYFKCTQQQLHNWHPEQQGPYLFLLVSAAYFLLQHFKHLGARV